MIGPGKYDSLCTKVREEARARAVILIVVDGDRGSGFSVQAPPEQLVFLPDLLEIVADKIRKEGPEA